MWIWMTSFLELMDEYHGMTRVIDQVNGLGTDIGTHKTMETDLRQVSPPLKLRD